MNRSVARKVMGLGRGLDAVVGKDGSVSYEPTPETTRRADEMGRYYRAYPGRLAMLLCSGRFQEVASKGEMVRPPEGESEAAKKAERLIKVWKVPEERVKIEDDSGSTFDNFIKSIKAKYLVPEEFDPDNPLALSVSWAHSWRAGRVAEQSLALPPGSLLRLRDGNLENGAVMDTRERVGYALTCLALAEVGAGPGKLEHTEEASRLFNDWAQSGVTALGKIGCSPKALISLMRTPDIPVAVY